LNIPVRIITNPSDIFNSTHSILPGVGTYDFAMKSLKNSGFINAIKESVYERKLKILGICVGMQILGNYSEEGSCEGLGLIEGHVRKFSDEQPLPHMGWNTITIIKDNILFKDMISLPRFYYLHSYYFKPKNPLNIMTLTNYKIDFASSITMNSVYGVQFHPEKSHRFGISLLKSFSEI